MLTIVLYTCAVLVSIRLSLLLVHLWKRRSFEWLNDGTQWAVITGGTDGTGYEFARQLALKGYHLMILARNEQKLKNTRQRILQELSNAGKCAVQVRTLSVDFARLDIYEQIKQFVSVSGEQVFVLVNNVGTCPPMPEYFVNETERDHAELINVNVVAATRMLDIVLPSMTKKRRGLVLNVCSVASRHLFALASTYSATKAYLGHLSECLALEYAQHEITFCTLYPSAISTKMIYHAREDFMTASPEAYVRSALDLIQYREGIHTAGFWSHSVLDFTMQLLTVLLSKPIMGSIIQFCTVRYRQLIIRYREGNKSEQQSFNMWNVLNVK